jgi:FkbM family methyltransferase
MKIVGNGIAVLENGLDNLLSRWVERDGDLQKYDPRIRSVLLPMIPVGGVVIDGGACIGDHTTAYAEKVGRWGQVFAFEPYANSFQCLLHNTRDMPQVVALPLGLGETFARCSLKVSTYNAGLTHFDEAHGSGFPVVPLDFFEFRRVDYIKLDLEGYELKALRGATVTIRKHRPLIVVETGPQLERVGDSHDEMVSLMAEWNYRCEDLPRERPGDSVYDVLFRPV